MVGGNIYGPPFFLELARQLCFEHAAQLLFFVRSGFTDELRR